jgi:hypothetical protein
MTKVMHLPDVLTAQITDTRTTCIFFCSTDRENPIRKLSIHTDLSIEKKGDYA